MTNRTKVFAAAVAVVAGLGILVTVLRLGSARSDTVRIGSILVLSGNYKSQGEQIRDGQTLAMEEINTPKVRLDIVFRDSEGRRRHHCET